MPDVIKTGKKSELPAWSPQRPRMFFLHIPKTAGMSLRLFFSNQYPVSEILPANDWVQLLQVPTEYFEEYRLYQGHFSIGMLDLLPSARVGHIGIYREPRTLQAIE